MLDHPPPHDAEAERSLISYAIKFQDLPSVPPEMFYDLQCRRAAEAMLQNSVDGITLGHEEVKDRLVEGGMPEREAALIISGLSEIEPSFGSIEYLSEKVEELYGLREVIKVASTAIQSALKPGAKSSEVIDEIQASAMSIGIRKKSEGSTIEEIAKEEGHGIADKIDSGKQSFGIMTGIPFLDKWTGGFKPGQLIVVGARPSQGKSALAIGFVRAFCEAGKRVSLFSIEMTKREIYTRYLSMFTGIPMVDWETASGRANHDDLGDVYSKVRPWDLRVYDEDIETEAKIIRIARRDCPDVVVIDYLQLMRSAQKEDKRNAALGNITRALKVYAKCGATVILLSQINRNADKRDDPCPLVSELKDSGSIEQDADIIIFPFFKKAQTGEIQQETQPSFLCVAKHRNGPTGIEELVFLRSRCEFKELSRRDWND